MKPETQQVLNDLAKAGIDVSSIVNQIRVNPLSERQADNIIGGGILRQQNYQRYMNAAREEKERVEQQARELATLHDAQSFDKDLPQKTLERIKFLEDQLIATGEFEEASVRNVSLQEKTQLTAMVNNPSTRTNLQPNPQQQQQRKPVIFDDPMNEFDPNNFVDVQTHQAQLANIAYGSIATGMEVNAVIDELKALGVVVDRAKIREFHEALRSGMDRGEGLDQVAEKVFKISEITAAKQKADFDLQLKAAEDKGRSLAMQEAGIVPQRRLQQGRHVIFDRNKKSPDNPVANTQNNNEPPPPPPPKEELKTEANTNQFGDVEVFRNRGSRENRLSKALEVSDEVHEYFANDPTYVP